MSPWQQKLRNAIGSVKDHTTISLAKVSGTIAPELEVALVKATSHDQSHFEEKNGQEVVLLASASRAYTMACITHLSRRLSRTQNWIVAVKTLMLVHRLLKEADRSFQDDLFRESRPGEGMLCLSGFQDDSVACGWEYSAFVRTYALYLDELLDYNASNCGGGDRTGSGRLSSSSSSSCERRSGSDTFGSVIEEPRLWWLNVSLKCMAPSELLDRMPPVQRMVERVLACDPVGAARTDHLILSALDCIVRDSFQLYDTVNDGLGVLIDAFFGMKGAEGARAFEILTVAAQQNDALIAFYGFCKDVLPCRSSEYPFVQRIPEKLLEAMEASLQNLMIQNVFEQQDFGRAQNVASSTLPVAQECLGISTDLQLAELYKQGKGASSSSTSNAAPTKEHQEQALIPLSPMVLTKVSPWQAFANREVLQAPNRPAREDKLGNGWMLALSDFGFNQRPPLNSASGQSSGVSSLASENFSLLTLGVPNTQSEEDPFAASSSISPPSYV